MYLQRSHSLRNYLLSICVVILVLIAATDASAQKDLEIVSPKGSTLEKPFPSTGGSRMRLKFKVADPVKMNRIRIVSYAETSASQGIYTVTKTGEQSLTLNLLKGLNRITLYGYLEGSDVDDKSPNDKLFITCNESDCGSASDLIVNEPGGKDDDKGKGKDKGDGGSEPANIVISTENEKDSDGQVAIFVKGEIKTLTVTVHDANDERVFLKTDLPVKTYGNTKVVMTKVALVKGKNIVRAYDSTKWEARADPGVARLECTKEKCGETTADGAAATKIITVQSPDSDTISDSSFRDVHLVINKHEGTQISKIKYFVMKNGTTVVDGKDVEEASVEYKDGKGKALVKIKFVEGENFVTFYDVNSPLDDKRHANLRITCKGPKCANDFLISTVPTNSINTRVVVGMEQVGASSAASETKPFLDFFFTNGILFSKLERKAPKDGFSHCDPTVTVKKGDKEDLCGLDGKRIKVPRLATWGLIRFSTTPQQTASFAVLPSNFVNQITDPSKIVDLVQSFDYMAGVEVRIASANGYNWTLLPGIRQKSRLYVSFGGGAISPLTPARTSAQIFKIPAAATTGPKPTPASPQREDFENRFGPVPADKTYVGFVPLERDRFFRQYYLSFRIKSHFCETDDCFQFKNSFPSMIDFGIGQNEAVTGGSYRQQGKRAWVIRLDGFYPLPFRQASFLYLYGSALMKLGFGGPKIEIPLFLDIAPGEIQITDPAVFIPPPDQQPSRLNRDYYKIGVGVNLTDLFNRNKTTP